jgi:hypothetical protein
MDENNISNKPAEKLDVEVLIQQHEYLQRAKYCAESRSARCEKLMKRHSSKKWRPKKVARMVRRSMTAMKEIEQSQKAIDYVKSKLDQVKGV